MVIESSLRVCFHKPDLLIYWRSASNSFPLADTTLHGLRAYGSSRCRGLWVPELQVSAPWLPALILQPGRTVWLLLRTTVHSHLCKAVTLHFWQTIFFKVNVA